MHVADTAMGVIPKKVTEVTADVLVKDDAGNPVAGVAVSGAWSGAVNGTEATVSDASGIASFSSPGLRDALGQRFVFAVTDASLACSVLGLKSR